MSAIWDQVLTHVSRSYVCGYCGESVSSEKAYIYRNHVSGIIERKIYICHKCNKPTFFDDAEEQTPGEIYGEEIQDISVRYVLYCRLFTRTI